MQATEFVIDLSIARGFDCTGMVFKTVHKISESRNIRGGGRYDNLLASSAEIRFLESARFNWLISTLGALKNTIDNGPANPANVVISHTGEDAQVYSLGNCQYFTEKWLKCSCVSGQC